MKFDNIICILIANPSTNGSSRISKLATVITGRAVDAFLTVLRFIILIEA